MYRMILALASASVLVACSDGEPLDSGNNPDCIENQPLQCTPETPVVEEEVDDPVDEVFATPFSEDRLTMNGVNFDDSGAQPIVEISNIPFDGDGTYSQDAAATTALGTTAGTGFGVYTNDTGQLQYYAVFRRTSAGTDNYSQVTAVGGDGWSEVGYGGGAAQRLNGHSGALPESTVGYTFTGEYAAVRTTVDDSANAEVQYVAGTANLIVDPIDLQGTGSVAGSISNRTFYDTAGNRITDLDNVDVIALDRANIDFDNWVIEPSSAQTRYARSSGSTSAGDSSANGNWSGVFTGPNGEEVAGIVVMDGNGPIGIDATTSDFEEIQVREVGGFVAVR